MSRRIGGQNLEGQYFIVAVPDSWTQGDPLPPPSPDDRWFDRISDFKMALDCPWVRGPMRYARWKPPAEARQPNVVRSVRSAPAGLGDELSKESARSTSRSRHLPCPLSPIRTAQVPQPGALRVPVNTPGSTTTAAGGAAPS